MQAHIHTPAYTTHTHAHTDTLEAHGQWKRGADPRRCRLLQERRWSMCRIQRNVNGRSKRGRRKEVLRGRAPTGHFCCCQGVREGAAHRKPPPGRITSHPKRGALDRQEASVWANLCPDTICPARMRPEGPAWPSAKTRFRGGCLITWGEDPAPEAGLAQTQTGGGRVGEGGAGDGGGSSSAPRGGSMVQEGLSGQR